MRQVRLGSYSIVKTVAGISYLFRLKSMTRYRRLFPPPVWCVKLPSSLYQQRYARSASSMKVSSLQRIASGFC